MSEMPNFEHCAAEMVQTHYAAMNTGVQWIDVPPEKREDFTAAMRAALLRLKEMVMADEGTPPTVETCDSSHSCE